MGLFRTRKGSASTVATPEDGSATAPAESPQRRLKKKFGFGKGKQPPPQQPEQPEQPQQPSPAAEVDAAAEEEDAALVVAQVRQQLREQRDSHREAPSDGRRLGDDVPRSISHQSRDVGDALPRPGAEQEAGNAEDRADDDLDSLGSPVDAALQLQRRQQQERRRALGELLASEPAPSLERLGDYVEALGAAVSPDPSADLPSRALRCLFGLSERAGDKAQRIAMVAHGERVASGGDGEADAPEPLVPALLAFLRRCPRDSSEQYLALLVLNNLSIPTANKPLVARDHGAAAALGRLLCEDPGCHLLVIVLVNLTFGDDNLNRDLLTGGGEEGEGVQLVESLGYALLLSSLTTDQLAALGPIPLASPDGVPHTPRHLLTALFAALEDTPGARRAATSPGPSDAGPFPETARWCLGALKNLTRPGRRAPSDAVGAGDAALRAHGAAAAVASRAVLDAGLLPPLLDVLRRRGDEGGGLPYGWPANSAQDAGLYTLLHMASVPWAREVLRIERGCVEVLVGILNYGRVISDRLRAVTLSGGGAGGAAGEEEEDQLGRAGLQCLKARIALSYLVLGSENNAEPSQYGSVTTLSEHETLSLVDLLSHCLQGRSKEGPGGYSAATFTLKGVLHAVRCILSAPQNRGRFAASLDGCRLNVLLLKVVAQYALRPEDVAEALDAEAAEHAAVSLSWMTLYAVDEAVVGFSNPLLCQQQGGGAAFLPILFGASVGKKMNAQSAVARVFAAYLGRDDTTLRGRHAATQILFRMNYLQFKGVVSDMAYPGNACPTNFPFDMDEKLGAAIESVSGDSLQPEGARPKEYIFGRAISRKEKEVGVGSKVFSNAKGVAGVTTFPNALSAAEDLVAQQPTGPVDTVAIANHIAYYADGLDVYHGFFWKWGDGNGDSIERIYSAAETENDMLSKESVTVTETTERSEPYSPPRTGLLARLKIPSTLIDDSEPISIFGFVCGSPTVCTKR